MTGGFALGAYWAGMRFENHYFSEVDPYCVELYKLRFPDAIALGDITKHEDWRLADGDYIITGGYPCQPFSTASRGRRTARDLWPWMADCITQIKPVAVIAENVDRQPIAKSRACLESLGYECKAMPIAGSTLGADHDRKRWWLLAYTNGNSKSRFSLNAEVASIPEIPRLVAWETDLSTTLGMEDGISYRMDRLKALGNSIVPQIAELLFRQINTVIQRGK
jgi:DNA (cytosine-5)-methyltransferase 1